MQDAGCRMQDAGWSRILKNDAGEVIGRVGVVFAGRHVTYRRIFNENIEFQRSTIIPVNTKDRVIKGGV